MPAHPDRIRENYNGICELCLKNPISLFASRDYLAINRYNICEECLEERIHKIEKKMISEAHDADFGLND